MKDKPKPDPEKVRAWLKWLSQIEQEAERPAYRALFVKRRKK